MPPTPFSELARLCKDLESTTKRKEKKRFLAEFLRDLQPDEVAPAVLLIVGSVFPEFDTRTLEVGWRTMSGVLSGGRQTTLFQEPLTIKGVRCTLEEIAEVSGEGSRRIKINLLEGLISRASLEEVEVLVRIIFREMRIGVNEGMMLEGIAEAAGVPSGLTRRALMLTGDLGAVAETALEEGEAGLRGIPLRMFVPMKPMLATMSYDIVEVIEEHGGETAFEFKFDGARIQIHRQGDGVQVFSRRLSDVTQSLPDVVDLIMKEIRSGDVILEGEAVAMGEGDKPLLFQDLMRRFRRVHNIEETVKKIPIKLHLFDVLYKEGRLLIDEPYTERWRILKDICPNGLLAQRIVTRDLAKAREFLKEAMESGHEGLMAKRLDSAYTPGVRGKGWFKIKPVETLDLVIVAADWGYGRRSGWLSNYHFAARDGGEYRVIGKTFKGLTDEEFRWMTARLQELKVEETQYTVKVRPEVIIEVAFNEIQRSPQYKSGFALRFARVTRIREDKWPEDADTIERVKEIFEKQFKYKARTPHDL